MGTDTIIWLAAVLVIASVLVKMLAGSFISRQKRELASLESELRKRQGHLESVLDQRESVEQNLEFFERRLAEDTEGLEKLQEELLPLEEAERKHLEQLGHDPDAEVSEDAPVSEDSLSDEGPATEEGPVTTQSATAPIDLNSPIAVVPTTLRDPDKLFLPDAIVAELLDLGITVIDRSVLTRKTTDLGLDLGVILEKEEFLQLDAVDDVQLLAEINTRMRGRGVGSATCRMVQIPSGHIVLSTSYDQPGSSDASPDFEPLSITAKELARSIHQVLDNSEESS